MLLANAYVDAKSSMFANGSDAPDGCTGPIPTLAKGSALDGLVLLGEIAESHHSSLPACTLMHSLRHIFKNEQAKLTKKMRRSCVEAYVGEEKAAAAADKSISPGAMLVDEPFGLGRSLGQCELS
jgi:hypothetical protein